MTGAGARCPCGLPAAYDDCCARLHRGEAAAPTAERLMRSRYSAFAVGDAAYLLATAAGGLLDATGTVRFRASYEGGVQEEDSLFAREDGAWRYLRAT